MAPTACLVVVGLTLGLVLGEALLCLPWPTESSYRVLEPGLLATFDVRHLSGVRGPSLYKVSSAGARGREWWSDRQAELRVLCMGGSATECLVTDQERVWTTLLEDRLARPDGRRTWVGNVGKSGLSSREHVLQARHLAAYDPDVVVLMAGVNDLSIRLGRGEEYDPHFGREPAERLFLAERAFAVAPGALPGVRSGDAWFRRTRIWRLMRMVRHKVLGRPKAQDPEGTNIVRWRRLRAAGRRTHELPSLDAALGEYERNLREIVGSARARGVSIVLVSQPVLWREGLTNREKSLLWLGGVGDFRRAPGSLYYEPEALARGMDAYNETMLDVCRDTGAECVDLARSVPRTAEYFYDDCHFTDKAQPLIADAVAEGVSRVASARRQP